MKATGIVRRIDDLGRVIIPKEVRRSINLHEGDPLEIFLDDGGLVLRKYNLSEEQMRQQCAAYVSKMNKKISMINFVDGKTFVIFENGKQVTVTHDPNDIFSMDVALCYAFEKAGYTLDNPIHEW